MKRHLTILSMAFTAVLVFAAISVASASASQPEFSLQNGAEKSTFTSESPAGTNSVLETKGGHIVICQPTEKQPQSQTNNGEIINKTEDWVDVEFHGCHIEVSGLKFACTSTEPKGSESGQIKLVRLKSHLYYAKNQEGKEVVVIDLTPEGNPGGQITKFTCATFPTETIKVKGAVDGELTPINTAEDVSNFHLKFRQSSQGIQDPVGFLNPANCTETVEQKLEAEGSGPVSFGFEQAAEETEDQILPAVPGKVVATKCE